MAVTYAGAHYVFRILGHFGASGTAKTEPWSTGFRLGDVASGDVPGAGGLTSFLEAVYPAIQTFHSAAAARAGTNCFLTELTAARVGTDGKYNPNSQTTARRLYAAPVAGNGSITMPWSTAMVISLRTSFPRGIASNGRTYYPAAASAVDASTGRLSAVNQSAYGDAAKTMITGINTAANGALGNGVRVCVMGATGVTGPARTAVVTSIRVDQRLDAIERRENAVPASWYSVVIP